MNEVTILYYTSNREIEKLENKVKEIILQNKGDLPIVSVSQKPIDFGKNICVGEHENSYFNEFRQIQIGLRAIETPFVLVCEADVFYPPAYFKFVPPETGKIYRYNNVWIHWCRFGEELGARFHFKGLSNGAQIVDRQIFLDIIDESYKGLEDWDGVMAKDKVGYFAGRYNFDPKNVWGSDSEPVVTLKSGYGVSSTTQWSKKFSPRRSLPYWGKGEIIRSFYE